MVVCVVVGDDLAALVGGGAGAAAAGLAARAHPAPRRRGAQAGERVAVQHQVEPAPAARRRHVRCFHYAYKTQLLKK